MNDTPANGASQDDEEIILADLSDEDLVKQMMDDLYDGLKDEICEAVRIFLDRGWAPYKISPTRSWKACGLLALTSVMEFWFVPEVLLSANAMKEGWKSCARSLPKRERQKSARWSSARSREISTTSARILSS